MIQMSITLIAVNLIIQILWYYRMKFFKAFMSPQIGHNCKNHINLSSEQIDKCILVIKKKKIMHMNLKIDS